MGSDDDANPRSDSPTEEFCQRDEATVERSSDSSLQHLLKTIWQDAEAESSSPTATIQVRVSHLAGESSLAVQHRRLGSTADVNRGTAEYNLLEYLAQGGMGEVWIAEQTSLRRRVALKTLKDDGRQRDRRDKFLAEAAITAQLDHPNIVPIHDLCIGEDGVPYYSMKLITGSEWGTCLATLPREENLRILLQVADAIAFAHSHRVIHRDLKPSNVMIGGFGEVLVVDWGLATRYDGQTWFPPGGTPAYMAPEMARHQIEQIGAGSDVYLLGAILFEIIVGSPPHLVSNRKGDLIAAAAKNRLAPHPAHDEFVKVALRAMQTDPAERYANVAEFQQAVRECQRHDASRQRMERAIGDLNVARRTSVPDDYARSVFGFRDALELWEGNDAARQQLDAATLEYAESAYQQGNFDLGLSLLDASDGRQQALYAKLSAAKKSRDARARRLLVARFAVVVLSVALAGIMAFLSRQQEIHRQRLEEENVQKELARKEALASGAVAEWNRVKAQFSAARATVNRWHATWASIKARSAEALEKSARAEAE
ncbi:MAG TPA: serine/threonine-protein kinase, partial [Lacipirellulaceae bacterium]|nr:serine/threonine-protein kinase [Lacipirellulaceae bacterium]